MLFILFSWLYILTCTFIVGVGFKQIIGIRKINTVTLLFFGFFGIILFAGFWAIFFAINWQFHGVFFVLTSILYILNIEQVKLLFLAFKKNILQLSPFFKILLAFITFFILAQCASPPYIIDNESYYIQTIKWLNEYGFVKGLANLHMFLGQTSGWHILQSVFNFSFIYDNFNDLSGLALLIGNYYAFLKLNDYLFNNKKSIENLIIGLLPLFNIFFFQFISAPSPDIPIYIIGFIIFYQFIKNYTTFSKDVFITISLLAIFATLIKLTAIIFCVFPLVFFIKHFTNLKKAFTGVFIIGTTTLLLFIIKNSIITGNPLYPLPSNGLLTADWELPKPLESFFLDQTKYYGYFTTVLEYNNTSAFYLFKKWLFLPKLHGLFNKLMVIIIIITPLFFIKKKVDKPMVIIYLVSILNMAVLFCTSPQYRFFFVFLAVLILWLLAATFLKRKKIIYTGMMLSLFITAIPLFYPIKLSQLTNNDFHLDLSHFTIAYFIKPHKNSQYSNRSETLQVENTIINSPTNIDFFWGTGDVKLPALKKEQLEYFKKYFRIIPQQRTKYLKDGFYSKVIADE